MEVAAESDAFKQLPAAVKQQRMETLADTLRQLQVTVVSSPFFLALRGTHRVHRTANNYLPHRHSLHRRTLCSAVLVWSPPDSLVARLAVQASVTASPALGGQLYDADLICYGIGRFSTSLPSRLQFAILLALRTSLPLASHCSLQLYDPLLSSLELAVLQSLGISLIDHNEEAMRRVSRCTVFYMPHCGQALYNNLLWSNWALYQQNDDERDKQQSRSLAVRNGDEEKQEDELVTVEEQLLSALSSVRLTSDPPPAHLGHVVLVGNRLSAYIEKRSFSSNNRIPSNSTSSRRSAQRPSYQSSRCPIHSTLPSTPLSVPSNLCRYECVCLVDALHLLHARSFYPELQRCDEDMRLAFHDTAVQWFDWSDVSDTERERVEYWLRQRLAEPMSLADDGELVSSAKSDDGG